MSNKIEVIYNDYVATDAFSDLKESVMTQIGPLLALRDVSVKVVFDKDKYSEYFDLKISGLDNIPGKNSFLNDIISDILSVVNTFGANKVMMNIWASDGLFSFRFRKKLNYEVVLLTGKNNHHMIFKDKRYKVVHNPVEGLLFINAHYFDYDIAEYFCLVNCLFPRLKLTEIDDNYPFSICVKYDNTYYSGDEPYYIAQILRNILFDNWTDKLHIYI